MKSGKLKAAGDVEELGWVSFDEVENLDLTEGFRKFIKKKRLDLEKLDSFKA